MSYLFNVLSFTTFKRTIYSSTYPLHLLKVITSPQRMQTNTQVYTKLSECAQVHLKGRTKHTSAIFNSDNATDKDYKMDNESSHKSTYTYTTNKHSTKNNTSGVHHMVNTKLQDKSPNRTLLFSHITGSYLFILLFIVTSTDIFDRSC